MDHELLLRSRRAAVTGVEFDWLLVDRRGEVALCCSFADGEVPDVILELDELQRKTFQEAVTSLGRRLPVLGTFGEEGDGMGSDFESPEFAKRGIYVFDWKPWSGPYSRVLLPTVPVQFSSVEAHLGSCRDQVPVADVLFAETLSFHLPTLLPCR
jgi:hypothetical protein